MPKLNKNKEIKSWHEGYQEGYNEGFKKGMEVARNSFAYQGRSRSSILGSRKYGLSEDIKKKFDEREVSILGSRRYGKSILLHSELEQMAKEELNKPIIQDDCVCDTGDFSCDSSCDCSSNCDCDSSCDCDCDCVDNCSCD